MPLDSVLTAASPWGNRRNRPSKGIEQSRAHDLLRDPRPSRSRNCSGGRSYRCCTVSGEAARRDTCFARDTVRCCSSVTDHAASCRAYVYSVPGALRLKTQFLFAPTRRVEATPSLLGRDGCRAAGKHIGADSRHQLKWATERKAPGRRRCRGCWWVVGSPLPQDGISAAR